MTYSLKMIRRKFIQDAATYTLGGISLANLALRNHSEWKDLIVGHNTHKYKIDMSWGAFTRTKLTCRKW